MNIVSGSPKKGNIIQVYVETCSQILCVKSDYYHNIRILPAYLL